jgi:hypothetical protein
MNSGPSCDDDSFLMALKQEYVVEVVMLSAAMLYRDCYERGELQSLILWRISYPLGDKRL